MDKARIACFGHGWCLETPCSRPRYVGSFSEAIAALDEVRAQVQIAACMNVYQARMGQVQTQGKA